MNHLNERAAHTGVSCRLVIAVAALLAWWWSFGVSKASGAEAPLALERSIAIPGVPVGPYSDHMAIDVAGGRLFTTPQADKAVAVIDLNGGRVIKMIFGLGNPHAIYYSRQLRRLFVSDGKSGSVIVFNSENYSLIKRIPLALGTDSLIYDPGSQLIYVMNGGEDAGMNDSLVSVVDPVGMKKIADIRVASVGQEGPVVDSKKGLLYLSFPEESAVGVVDLNERRQIATWKVPAGAHSPFALALDAAHDRLYVACRDDFHGFALHGTIFVLNTANGRSLAALPIGGWVDGVFFDQKRQRIYASTGVGYIDTYRFEANHLYRRLTPVETPLIAKTSLYSSELDRFFISVPHLADTEAQILVFKPSP